MGCLKASMLFLRAMLISKVLLALEILALRQPLAVSHQSGKRPKLRPHDRVFWAWLSRLWPNCRTELVIVRPETVTERKNGSAAHVFPRLRFGL